WRTAGYECTSHRESGSRRSRTCSASSIQSGTGRPPSRKGVHVTLSRRTILAGSAATAAAALLPRRAFAASKAKLRIGLLLPYSGTYAALGNNITDAMKLAAQEHGGKLGGREVEWVAVDDESDP